MVLSSLPLTHNLLPPSAVIPVVVCHATKVQLLLDQAENCPSLRLIVKMGGQVTEEEKEQATKTGLTVTTFEEVEVRIPQETTEYY